MAFGQKKKPPSILFIEEEDTKEELIHFSRKTKEWLYEQLVKKGYDKIEEVLYGEWSKTDGFYAKTYQQSNV